jgi:hypothetical protein
MTICAIVDSNNNVLNTIVANPTDVAPLNCVLVEITNDTNGAGTGYVYIPQANKFQGPTPYPSWVLNTATYLWEAPKPMPNDGKEYYWDEPTVSWIEAVV